MPLKFMPLGTNPGHTAVQKMRDPNRCVVEGQVQFLMDRTGPIAWDGASLVDDFSTMIEVTTEGSNA